jgi:phosphoserine phosphatase
VIQFRAVGSEKNFNRASAFKQTRRAVAMPVQDRAAGRLQHFKRASDAGPVSGMEALCGLRIARNQFRIKLSRMRRGKTGADGRADSAWNRRDRRKPVEQGLEIKPAAAGKNGEAPGTLDLRQCGAGLGNEPARRIIFRRIDMAIEKVGRPGLFGGAGPRGDNLEIAVDLHRIGIDDGAAEALRKRKRERRLATRGRPCNKHRHACAAMIHVATLIAGPAQSLTDAILRTACAALPAPVAVAWLDAERAVDLRFAAEAGNDKHRLITDRLRAALGKAAIDVVVQHAERRRKQLLVADMDSTMIGQECLDELADFVGCKAQVAAITERAMRGEIAFAPALRERVRLLAGLPVAAMEEVLLKRISPTPGAPALVATMRRHGAYACLVSGGFTLFTGAIAARLGFDEHRGNRLIIGADGRLTGAVAEPVLGPDAKLETLRELRSRLGLGNDDTLAVGDGANDLGMIEEAGFGVAFRAKPVVAEAAAACIDHADLTALLYIQGYRREDIRA